MDKIKVGDTVKLTGRENQFRGAIGKVTAIKNSPYGLEATVKLSFDPVMYTALYLEGFGEVAFNNLKGLTLSLDVECLVDSLVKHKSLRVMA